MQFNLASRGELSFPGKCSYKALLSQLAAFPHMLYMYCFFELEVEQIYHTHSARYV
jgi:hypothetical protein